jgi:hypothetical protein
VLLFLTAGAASARDATAFPLQIEPSGRYLVDQRQQPFRIQGEAAWDLVVQLSLDQVEAYLANRARHGFNTVLVELVERKRWIEHSSTPSTRDGLAPFMKAGDFSTPNDAYFSRVAAVLDRAAARGMLVLLTPLYLGLVGRDEGWWPELNSPANTPKVCRAFGKYLAQGAGGSFHGFKDAPNVVWVEGGDFFPPVGSEGSRRAHQLMEGLQAGGAHQLQTGHWSEEHVSTDHPDFAAAMNLNAVYTYGPNHDGLTHSQARRGYDRGPASQAIPAFLIETQYETDGWLPPRGPMRLLKRAYRAIHSALTGTPPALVTRPEELRRAMYWAALSTIGGAVFGNEQLWRFDDDWMERLNTVGALDTERMGQLLDALPWQDLVPSGLGSLAGRRLISGRDDTAVGGDIVAAADPAGTALVAYVPSTGTASRTFAIEAGAVQGAVQARWYNPARGGYLAIDPSPAPSGARTFVTPGNNGTGTNDWVLVLRTGR